MSAPSAESDSPFAFLGPADPRFDHARLRAGVDAIVDGMGATSDQVGHDRYIGDLRDRMQRDEATGIEYLLLADPDPAKVSTERLVVLSTPFGKQPRELVVLAELMHQLARVVPDDQGRVPSLLLVGPPRWSTLPRPTKEGLYHGELGGLAIETLQLIKRIPQLRNIGWIAGIGFSYAATLTSAIGCRAAAEGFDIGGICMASPGDTVARHWLSLFRSFGAETTNKLAGPYKVANPAVFNKANDVGDVEFWAGLIANARQNWHLMGVLALGRFMDRLRTFGHQHPMTPATVVHGSRDRITPHEPIVARYGALASDLGSTATQWLVATDAHHPWGHDARRLATAVAYSFQRIAEA